MAYEIQPFRLLDANATNATGYEGGMGNPNDYEYYVDPATRTVKRRAKQGLPAFAGTAAPTSGGEGGGFTAAPSAGSTFGTAGKAGGPSLASQNANLAMMDVGSKLGKVPGLIGLLGIGLEAFGRHGAGNDLGYIGDNMGLLDSSPLGGTALASDTQGNLFSFSNPATITAQDVDSFGPSMDTGPGSMSGLGLTGTSGLAD